MLKQNKYSVLFSSVLFYCYTLMSWK